MPLVTREPSSDRMLGVYAEDRGQVVWWGTLLECATALARLGRQNVLAPRERDAARSRLQELSTAWMEVPPGDDVRDQAIRAVRLHPLRASDAFQLAAAQVASAFRAGDLESVTLDARLAEAADREGFKVLG